MVDRIGVEFAISSNPGAPGGDVSIAGHDDGSYLVAWTAPNSNDVEEGYYYDEIFGRAFTYGTAYAPDFIVNTEMADPQRSPQVAARADGSYVVAYSSGEENHLPGTYAASQVIGGTGMKVGDERLGSESYYHRSPDVATFADGSYLVVSTGEDVGEGKILSTSGALLSGFTFGTDYFLREKAAVAVSGDAFLVFWQGYPLDDPFGELDGLTPGLYGQYRTTDGSVIGKPFLVDAFAARADLAPTARLLSNGSVAIAWQVPESPGDPASPTDVMVTVIDPATGVLAAAPFAVTQLTIGNQRTPEIAALDDGRFVVTWQEDAPAVDDPSETAVRARVFSDLGGAQGDAFLVNTDTEGFQGDPSIAGIGSDDFVIAWTGAEGIKAQLFSAGAPVAADDGTFVVNTSVAGFQDQPAVTRLSNGGFVVVWSDLIDTGETGDHRTDIKAQIYDAAGAKVGGELTVNTTTTDADEMPRVTTGANGSFAVAWIHGSDEMTGGSYAALQKFDATGGKVGTEILTHTNGFSFHPEIAVLESGRTVLTWQNVDTDRIDGRIYLANGTLAASFHTEGVAQLVPHDLVALKGGSFALAYTEAGGETAIHIAQFDYRGNQVSETVVADAPGAGSDQVRPAIAALPDGGYVVTWQEYDNETGTAARTIYAQVFSKAGPIGAAIEVAQADVQLPANASVAYNPSVAVLADGRFVIGWAHDQGTHGDWLMNSQVFTREGDRSGDEHAVATHTTTPDVTLAAVDGASYVVSWEDSGANGDGDGSGIKASIVEAPLLTRGNDVAETLTDGDGGGTIYGGGGADVISGDGGNDLIYGDKGADTIHGDGGDDLIYGGVQNDTLYGDAGADQIFGAVAVLTAGNFGGIDRIEGGTGDDILSGDARTIAGGGGGGNDLLFGGDGQDMLYGDAITMSVGATGGNDRLFGGLGDDTIYGDAANAGEGVIGGNDIIEGGGGQDQMWGGGGNDVFTFSAPSFSYDVIRDFGQVAGNRDQINLRAFHLTFADLQLVYQGDSMMITAAAFGPGALIQLDGVQSMTMADFLF